MKDRKLDRHKKGGKTLRVTASCLEKLDRKRKGQTYSRIIEGLLSGNFLTRLLRRG